MLTEVVLALLAAYFLWQALRKPSAYPPGPWGLPLIGYVPFGKPIYDVIQSFQKDYGDIVSCRVGARQIVMLFDYKVAKEAFAGPDFVNRPEMKFVTIISGETILGAVTTNGLHWQNIRRFSLRHLKDLGMGKSKMVSDIQFEASEFVREFKKQAGKPASTPRSLIISVLNITWQLVANKRYDLQDAKILEFDELLNNLAESFGRLALTTLFPWIHTVLPDFIANRITKKDVHSRFTSKLRSFIEIHIAEHQKTLDPSNPRDFIDDYLIELDKQNSEFNSTMSIEDLIFCIGDFFGAGSETISNTIRWAILYLADNPKVQKNLQEEIDRELPRGTTVAMNDRARLPYTDAFIHEVLRYSRLTPLGLMHEAVRDTTLGGYVIPKGAILLHATGQIHFDSKYFSSPEEFSPERFLDSNGKFVSPKDGFLPFGTGKRQCLGESLARMELLVFLTTIVQDLHFSVPPGKKLDLKPMEEVFFVNLPKEQNILTTIRS